MRRNVGQALIARRIAASRMWLHRYCLAAVALNLVACDFKSIGAAPSAQSESPDRATAAGQAHEEIDALEARIDDLNRKYGRAFWVAATFPSPDAEAVSAAVQAMMRDNHVGGIIEIERRFGPEAWRGPNGRKLMQLGHRYIDPTPEQESERAELAEKAAAFAESFNAIDICWEQSCFSPAEAEERMRQSDDAAERAALWSALRDETPGVSAAFTVLKNGLNDAAREWGYSNIGEWLIARYERTDEDWGAELEVLTDEIEPLAGALRCHVASELGAETEAGLIAAPALRSLWGRDWSHLHEAVRADLPAYEPLPLNVEARFSSVEEMVRWGESTYRSIGFQPLPESFWEGSQFVRPDRKIAGCPRFGTNVDWHKDVRLIMCGTLDAEHLLWSHGILAFLYYDLAFADQNWVYRDPPHLGFHFANSDAMELALTPEFLRREGLIDRLPTEAENMSRMLHEALLIVPRIGYDIAAERWRAEAYASRSRDFDPNERWRTLRERHQSVSTPSPAGNAIEPFAHSVIARNFELAPGALGQVLKFQFYKEACRSAQYEGPLHECSFYGSDAVGARLWPILEIGASQPWYEVLEAYTGSPAMSAAPLLEYFAPLQAWLAKQNADRECG